MAANNNESVVVAHIRDLVVTYVDDHVPAAINNRHGYTRFVVETDVANNTTWFVLKFEKHLQADRTHMGPKILWQKREQDYMNLLTEAVMAELAILCGSLSGTN